MTTPRPFLAATFLGGLLTLSASPVLAQKHPLREAFLLRPRDLTKGRGQ